MIVDLLTYIALPHVHIVPRIACINVVVKTNTVLTYKLKTKYAFLLIDAPFL